MAELLKIFNYLVYCGNGITTWVTRNTETVYNIIFGRELPKYFPKRYERSERLAKQSLPNNIPKS